MSRASIVIPVLNEAAEIKDSLLSLQHLRERDFEIILVDGGSKDNTVQLATGLCDQIITGHTGRARQMNIGAEHVRGDIIFFLHIDTRLPRELPALLPQITSVALNWGRFDIQFSTTHKLFKVIAAMMNLRSRYTGVATGDQVIFISKALYQQVGGFPDIPLMEDIAMSKKLRAIRPPLCLRERVSTSSRRWEQYGIIKTIIKMCWLRLCYFIGISPTTLARQYD